MTTLTLPADAPGLRAAFIAPLEGIEWRQSGNAHDYTFTGRAVVYDSWSEEMWTPLGTFRERVRPGAFTDVLSRAPDVRLLFNHDDRYVLARTRSGTLELAEEDNGLHVWARVAPTSYAKDLRMVMARGDVDQMSFAFMMDEERGAEDHWYEDEESGEIRRDIVKVSDLLDVSPVTYPAYVDTTAAMRELRSAVDAGKILIPEDVAQDEPADKEATSDDAEPPVDEVRDASAEAETDPPVSGSAVLRSQSREALRKVKEDYLRVS
jgi:HK97 family phage prohead protease